MIIGVDFDGTVVYDRFPCIGLDIPWAVEVLKEFKEQGHKLILITCREGKHLDAACRWFEQNGIELDAVNENIPGLSWEPRKVMVDAMIDDRAVGCPFFYRLDGARAYPNWPKIREEIFKIPPVVVQNVDIYD